LFHRGPLEFLEIFFSISGFDGSPEEIPVPRVPQKPIEKKRKTHQNSIYTGPKPIDKKRKPHHSSFYTCVKRIVMGVRVMLHGRRQNVFYLQSQH
jgi:hypothetical protein